MKQSILYWIINSWLLALYASLLRILRLLRLIHIHDSSCLILPPSAPGSVGDEAMMNATVAYLQEKGIKQVSLISYKPNLEWQGLDLISETLEMQGYFSYNDSRALKALLQFIHLVSHYEKFYCLGADMMDGAYYDAFNRKMVRLVSLAARMGVKAAILGFSFNEKPTLASVDALRNLPSSVKLCARDPVSQERLIPTSIDQLNL